MHYIYILYSAKFDKYYVGQTDDVQRRLLEHNELSQTSFTVRYRPWAIALSLEVTDRSTALRVERYIKKQKSKRYIQKLISSKDHQERLLARFSE